MLDRIGKFNGIAGRMALLRQIGADQDQVPSPVDITSLVPAFPVHLKDMEFDDSPRAVNSSGRHALDQVRWVLWGAVDNSTGRYLQAQQDALRAGCSANAPGLRA